MFNGVLRKDGTGAKSYHCPELKELKKQSLGTLTKVLLKKGRHKAFEKWKLLNMLVNKGRITGEKGKD